MYEELSHSIIGAALDVHRMLGPGFLEAVYERALAHEFRLRQIPFERQAELQVEYKGVEIGKYYPDVVIDKKIILEIKALAALVSAHEA